MLEAVRTALRIKSHAFDAELSDLIYACIADLKTAGVDNASAQDRLYRQAVILYCKANFGFSADSEKYDARYQSLKITMANAWSQYAADSAQDEETEEDD